MVIFEDDPNSIFCKLFREAYDKEISDKFIYTKGNNGIKKVIEGIYGVG